MLRGRGFFTQNITKHFHSILCCLDICNEIGGNIIRVTKNPQYILHLVWLHFPLLYKYFESSECEEYDTKHICYEL